MLCETNMRRDSPKHQSCRCHLLLLWPNMSQLNMSHWPKDTWIHKELSWHDYYVWRTTGATTFMVAKTFMRVLAISVYDNLGIVTPSCCCWQHGWKWCLLRSSDSWRVGRRHLPWGRHTRGWGIWYYGRHTGRTICRYLQHHHWLNKWVPWMLGFIEGHQVPTHLWWDLQVSEPLAHLEVGQKGHGEKQWRSVLWNHLPRI
jgi:hypothetical protein